MVDGALGALQWPDDAALTNARGETRTARTAPPRSVERQCASRSSCALPRKRVCTQPIKGQPWQAFCPCSGGCRQSVRTRIPAARARHVQPQDPRLPRVLACTGMLPLAAVACLMVSGRAAATRRG